LFSVVSKQKFKLPTGEFHGTSEMKIHYVDVINELLCMSKTKHTQKSYVAQFSYM